MSVVNFYEEFINSPIGAKIKKEYGKYYVFEGENSKVLTNVNLRQNSYNILGLVVASNKVILKVKNTAKLRGYSNRRKLGSIDSGWINMPNLDWTDVEVLSTGFLFNRITLTLRVGNKMMLLLYGSKDCNVYLYPHVNKDINIDGSILKNNLTFQNIDEKEYSEKLIETINDASTLIKPYPLIWNYSDKDSWQLAIEEWKVNQKQINEKINFVFAIGSQTLQSKNLILRNSKEFLAKDGTIGPSYSVRDQKHYQGTWKIEEIKNYVGTYSVPEIKHVS